MTAVAVLANVICTNGSRVADGVLADLAIAMIGNDRPRRVFAGRYDDRVMAGARTVDRVVHDLIVTGARSMDRYGRLVLVVTIVARIATVMLIAVAIMVVVARQCCTCGSR